MNLPLIYALASIQAKVNHIEANAEALSELSDMQALRTLKRNLKDYIVKQAATGETPNDPLSYVLKALNDIFENLRKCERFYSRCMRYELKKKNIVVDLSIADLLADRKGFASALNGLRLTIDTDLLSADGRFLPCLSDIFKFSDITQGLRHPPEDLWQFLNGSGDLHNEVIRCWEHFEAEYLRHKELLELAKKHIDAGNTIKARTTAYELLYDFSSLPSKFSILGTINNLEKPIRDLENRFIITKSYVLNPASFHEFNIKKAGHSSAEEDTELAQLAKQIMDLGQKDKVLAQLAKQIMDLRQAAENSPECELRELAIERTRFFAMRLSELKNDYRLQIRKASINRRIAIATAFACCILFVWGGYHILLDRGARATGLNTEIYKAAIWGNADAQCLVADKLSERKTAIGGKEAVKWYQKAEKNFREAADNGNSHAQYNLGSLYETGRGVPKDEIEAVKWYVKATKQGNEAALRSLESMLMSAVQNRNQAVVAMLLKLSANGNVPYNLLPSLTMAIQNNYLGITRCLLENGANANMANTEGLTPLMIAADKGYLEMSRLLVEKGASVNATNRNGASSLMLAAQKGQWAVVQLLGEHGAFVTITNYAGSSPLMFAVQHGRPDVVQTLLSKGASANTRTREGITPLLMATQRNQWNIVQLLVEHGAVVNVTNHLGYTPLMSAVQCERPDIVQMLLNKNANVNTADTMGMTPLMIAAQKGHSDIAILLLKKGASANAKNMDGETALFFAFRSGKPNLINLLMHAGAD